MQLIAEGVNKSFGTNHVLKDIAFTANSGVALGLLGRNGSGKTTTIRIIMGMFPADSGTVMIDGAESKKFGNRFGYLPEERGLYPKRVIADQMAYIGELRGMSAADARRRSLLLLEELGAGEYYKKKLDTLSKGNQQKIQLAIALINDPEIIILDEPFSGLDPVNAKTLKDLISGLVKEGKMVIFSSHQMSHVEEFCDDICMINDGRVVLHGNLKQIKKSYTRNRILLVPEDENAEALREKIGAIQGLSGEITEIKAATRGCAVTLRDEKDKPTLFNALAQSGIDVDSFAVMEPTLEEIFVEKAGEAYEAV
jgi:ABC-2 type transport system ATP-binding protein